MILEIYIHPILVHFPIACIYLALFFEILFFFNTKKSNFKEISYYLTIFATIGAVLSQLSGLFLTEHPEYGPIKEIFEQHELLAMISVILLLITSSFQTFIFYKNLSKKFKIISVLLILTCVIAISSTGYFGGVLVYDYMVK